MSTVKQSSRRWTATAIWQGCARTDIIRERGVTARIDEHLRALRVAACARAVQRRVTSRIAAVNRRAESLVSLQQIPETFPVTELRGDVQRGCDSARRLVWALALREQACFQTGVPMRTGSAPSSSSSSSSAAAGTASMSDEAHTIADQPSELAPKCAVG